MKPRTIVLCVAAALVFGRAAAAGPAVSSVNGKLEIGFLAANGANLGYGAGSIAAPLGENFGAQLDALYSNVGGFALGAAGGHVFWRDPKTALIGLTGSYVDVAGLHLNAIGLESEYYLGAYTLGATFDHYSGDAGTGNTFTISAAWYPQDDLQLRLAGNFAKDFGDVSLAAEWQVGESIPGLALFAQGDVGSYNARSLLIGLRFYFGPDKTLIRRHREDDPPGLSVATDGSYRRLQCLAHLEKIGKLNDPAYRDDCVHWSWSHRAI